MQTANYKHKGKNENLGTSTLFCPLFQPYLLSKLLLFPIFPRVWHGRALPEADDGANFWHENGEEDTDRDNDSVERHHLLVAGEDVPINRKEN